MESNGSDWYKRIWNLDIMDLSWVEETRQQVDFLVDKLKLEGDEKILDLACGYGRHSVELAARGFCVVGVDITKDYIDFAKQAAHQKNIDAHFIHSDIRDISFVNEFDVVINMGDGAIGYLENDAENLKIFDVIAKALKPKGKHFMDIMNADYAKHHFPCQLWDAGEKCLTLSRFEWNEETNTMMYGQEDYLYGEILKKPNMDKGNPTRLYNLDEIKEIMNERGLVLRDSFADFTGKKASKDNIQLMVYSQRE